MPANELTMIEQAAIAIAPLTQITTKALAAAARAAPAGIVVVAASNDDRDRLHTAHRDQPMTGVLGASAGAMFVVMLTAWLRSTDDYEGRPVLFDSSAIAAFAEDARRARDQYATQAEILRCTKEEAASLSTEIERVRANLDTARSSRDAAEAVIRDATMAMGSAVVGGGPGTPLAKRIAQHTADLRAEVAARDIVIKDASAALDRCGVGHPPPGASGLELSNRILYLASHLPPPPRAEDLLDPWDIELHALKDQIRKRHFLNAHFRAFVLAQKTWDEHVRLSNLGDDAARADVAAAAIKASFADLAKPMREALARDGIAAMRRALDPEGKHSNAELDDLIARSSVGAGLRNIEQNGIEAEAADLEAEADREVAIESMAAIRALIGAFITAPAKGSSYERLDRLIRKIIGIVAFGVPAPGADS